MFRRKKSSSTEAQQKPAISISGPMRITAQAPHVPSFHAPVYERFARSTTNLNVSAGVAGPSRRPSSNVRADGIEGAVRRPEIRQERIVGRSGAPGWKADLAPRAGMGMSTPSREDVSRVDRQVRQQQQQQQQVSPPSSPTLPRATPTLNVNTRQMPNVDSYALDDPIPPKSLLKERIRPTTEQKPVNVPRPSAKVDKEDTKLTRLLTPPSPPHATQTLPSSTPALSIPSTPSSRMLPRPSADPPVSSSMAPLTPVSPMVDETGALSGSSTLKASPSLGNSLEAPRGPRRAKYSPLAAFGPSVSTSTTGTSSSSVPHSEEVPPPLPPKPRTSVISPSVPSFNIDSSHADAPAQGLGVETSRPSNDSVFNPDRHASVQPLKTASVELRVALGADELETFHSPLFGFSTHANEERRKDDDSRFEPHVEHGSRQRREASNDRSKYNAEPMFPRSQSALHDSDDGDVGMEGRGETKRINMRGRCRSGRTATIVPPSTSERTTAPPTPPSPPAPDPTMLHDIANVTGETELARKRSASASSAGSIRRKVTMYAKFSDEVVPNVPAVQQDRPQTPRTVMQGQIPTPPTSVDGHGNEQNQRLTIASVLNGEYLPELPSSSAFDGKRLRNPSTTQRAFPNFSSPTPLASADGLANGLVRQSESHGNFTKNEMSALMPIAPSLAASASASASSAGMPYNEEIQTRPTPKLRMQNLPAQTYNVHLNHHEEQQQQPTPLSPPHSPPQPIGPTLSSSQSRSRARSKSRNRTNSRPDTGSSAHSLNYVPPSSASSSDGLAHSPSALSVLNPFPSGATGSNGHTPRKLVKTPPHSIRSMGESAIAAEQYRRTITESPEQMDGGLVDEDPFAKGEIVRAPPPPTTGELTPPVRPFAQSQSSGSGSSPSSPASPGDYFSFRTHRRGQRLEAAPSEALQAVSDLRNGMGGEETPRPLASEPVPEANENEEVEHESEPEPAEPTFYPIEKHLMQSELLGALLRYLEFRDWCMLTAVNDAMRKKVEHTRELRELVLEYFLQTVGYSRWRWSTKEHIMLTFRDLNSYMRGVSMPSYQYATHARAYLDAKQQSQERPGDEYLKFNLKTATAQKSLLASSCRAYSRIVLRLRAQAEAMERDAEGDEKVYQYTPPQSSSSVTTKSQGQSQLQNHARRSMSRARAGTPSRPNSSGDSSMSHSQHGYRISGTSNGHANGGGYSKVNRYERAALADLGPRFRSPLFRLGHAPCLRLFVPNAEGVWLSDASVLECERELKRAGIIPLLRVGDVVWDTAVGDEGNVGRMVWDGNYLIDMDYTYSRTGEVPQYLHTLSFPPSYFHRVIRTPGNPICHIDVSPWGEEIAANLQLLQDRIKTETPQGGYHTVVRWIHRSKFRIRPNPYTNAPIAIPGTSLSVDPGWYGTVIIEIEGTNEGLADLQQRCRSGFPPRAVGGENGSVTSVKPTSKVWRLLRERSRPAEIWLRAVREKERLL